MNMMSLIIVPFFILFSKDCWASDVNWKMDGDSKSASVEAQVFDKDFGLRIAIDAYQTTKRIDIAYQTVKGEDTAVVSFLQKNEDELNSFTFKTKVPFQFAILENGNFKLKNESILIAGVLNGDYDMPVAANEKNLDFVFTKPFVGVRNEIVSKFSSHHSEYGLRAGFENVSSGYTDRFGARSFTWDSYSLRSGAFIKSQFSEKVSFGINADIWRKKYNPESYFFTEKWTTETEIKSETTFLINKYVDVVPLLGYRRFDLERDGRVDLEEIQYGGKLTYKVNNQNATRFFLNTIRARKFNKRGSEDLMSFGMETKNLRAEIYQHQTIESFSDFKVTDRNVAANVSWKFGGRSNGLKNYQSVKEKYSFYHDSVSGDMQSLSLKQQAERLGNICRQSQWEQDNMNYKTADSSTSFRFANAVYSGRAGDCDEQSCLSNTMDKLNGYKSYSVAWYDAGVSLIGHAAKIVRDGNGRWFFIEYGRVFKINVNKNASVEEVANEAVKQNHMYSALPLIKNINPRYAIIDCNDGQTYNITNYVSLVGIEAVKRRPQVERGIELFTGKDFLFN